jgi:hypothetical protein
LQGDPGGLGAGTGVVSGHFGGAAYVVTGAARQAKRSRDANRRAWVVCTSTASSCSSTATVEASSARAASRVPGGAMRILLPERRELLQLRASPRLANTRMGDLWATMLPAAIAVALSPTGIIEMILVLFSARARVNVIVFLTSVMVSVFVLPLLGASMLGATVESDTAATSPGTGKAWVSIGLGVLLSFSPSATCGSGPKRLHRRCWTRSPAWALVPSSRSLGVEWFKPINALVLFSVSPQAASIDVSTVLLLSLPYSRLFDIGRLAVEIPAHRRACLLAFTSLRTIDHLHERAVGDGATVLIRNSR